MTDPNPTTPQDTVSSAERIAQLEAEVAARVQLQQAAERIAQLEAQLAQLTVATAPADATGNPKEPTHRRVLACGCSDLVTVPAATEHHCEEHDSLERVTAYHPLVTA